MKKWGFGGEHSFWSVAIAVGFYCLVLGISIGSLFDKSTCTGSDFGCFEFWINRYQTLLTAFGVIFAVAVAKAQMDANRRQHVAQIKRSFQKELDALQILSDFAKQVIDTNLVEASIIASLSGNKGVYIPRPVGSELSRFKEILPYNVTSICSFTVKLLGQTIDLSLRDSSTKEEIESLFTDAQQFSRSLLTEIEREEKRLSQYWS